MNAYGEPDRLLTDDPALVIRDLFSALQIRRLRGPADPRARERAAAFARSLLQAADERGAVRLSRSGPHLFVNRCRVRPHPEFRLAVRMLGQDLERLGSGGLQFEPGCTLESIEAFLDGWPGLEAMLSAGNALAIDPDSGRRRIEAPVPIAPGISLVPVGPETDLSAAGEDRRDAARRAFYQALAGSRIIVRQFAAHRIAELRRSRSLVHGLIESLCEEEFSLLGLSAIQDFDPYTFQHSVHVSILSLSLGQGLGLPRKDLTELGVAALFHDIGKLSVPKKVIQKPGRFDSREREVMHTHPLAGARELLRGGGASELAIKVMLVSAEHHLRFDNSGYPDLGEGWSQGLFSRIVSLADCYDAMTASRIYMKRPFTPDAVVRYMIENAGRMFDPDLLRLFLGKMGLYPVGSLVRLGSGETALVVEAPASAREVERPRVHILEGGPGAWRLGPERGLAAGSAVDPRRRIQAGLHPMDFGIQVDRLLSQFYLEPR